MSDDQRARLEELEKRAMAAKPPVRKIFGKVLGITLEEVGFDRVAGRYSAFDKSIHGDQRPSTKITIEVEAFKRAGTYTSKKDMIDTSKDWQDITRPSMIKVGLGLTTMQNRWVEIELRRTGRTWEDRSTGETKYAEAFFFTKVFPDEHACEAEYAEQFMGGREDPGDTSSQATNANGADAVDPAQSESMNRAATTVWGVVNKDEQQFIDTVSKNPMLMKHFGSAEKALEFVKAPTTDQAASPPAAKKTRNVPQPVNPDDEDEDLPF